MLLLVLVGATCTATVVIAVQQASYQFSGNVVIPEKNSFNITVTSPANQVNGTYPLTFSSLANNVSTATLRVKNKGTTDALLQLSSIDLSTDSKGKPTYLKMDFKYADNQPWSNDGEFFIIAKGTEYTITVRITDLGAAPGDHPVRLVLNAEPG